VTRLALPKPLPTGLALSNQSFFSGFLVAPPPVISEFCFQSCKFFLRRCGSHHNHAVGRLDVSLPTLNIDLASSRRSTQYIESLVFPFLTRE
jgi:hypothetical protein